MPHRPTCSTPAGRLALADRGLLSVFNHGSFEQRAGGLLVGATGSMMEVTAGGNATLNGTTVLNGSLRIEQTGRLEVPSGGTFMHRMQPGSTGINQGELVSTGYVTLGGTLGASTWLNEGVLANHNLLLVEVGTTLANTGTIVNHALMQVDGVLALHEGSQFVQFGGGLTINGTLAGGRIVSGDPLVIANGLLGGQGTIVGDVVMQGGVAGPGNSPGTLRVMGDMVLGSGSTLALEMARDGRHDQLQVDGRLSIEPGASVQLSFLGGAPDVDQTFAVLSAGGSGPDLGAATLLFNHPTLGHTVYNNGRTLALAFQEASALHFNLPDGTDLQFDAGRTYYIDRDLGYYGRPGVAGTLGLRADAALLLGLAEVAAGGRLLNSGGLRIGNSLINHGETINRGQLITLALENRGQFTNRGALTIGADGSPDGRFVNQGSFLHLAGNLNLASLDGAAVPVENAAGAEMRLAGSHTGRMALSNRGQVIVDRGGVLLASTVQQEAGELQVDGSLSADLTQVRGGVLGGTGALHGAVQIDDGAPDSFSLNIGTRLRPGLGGPGGDQALTFFGPVHLGTVYRGVGVEIDIASADSFGQLNFLAGLTVDDGAWLQFVLVDGFQPDQALQLPVLRFDIDRIDTHGLSFLLSSAQVWQRGAAGDQPWQGVSWQIDWQDGRIDLQLTPAPVPEPAAAGLLVGGLALLRGLAWRRRRAQPAAHQA